MTQTSSDNTVADYCEIAHGFPPETTCLDHTAAPAQLRMHSSTRTLALSVSGARVVKSGYGVCAAVCRLKIKVTVLKDLLSKVVIVIELLCVG